MQQIVAPQIAWEEKSSSPIWNIKNQTQKINTFYLYKSFSKMIRNKLTYTPHILPTILLLSEESLSGLTSFLTILFLRTTCLWSPTSCCCPCCWCHCSRLPRSPEHHWRPSKTVVDDCWIALWWELQLFAHLSWTFFSTILFSSECIRSQEASGDVFDLTWPFHKKIFYWLYSKINVYLFFIFFWVGLLLLQIFILQTGEIL